MSLVDLDPAVQVAFTGVLLSTLPLLWVAFRLYQQGGIQSWRNPKAWQLALTITTLFLTLDLVVFGAFTRLTDSGLGCPDWPGCYGSASPLGAHANIAQAQLDAPHGPVTHQKAWIEMIHRYLATMVGALITLLMGLAWHLNTLSKRQGQGASALSPWWATWTLIWVCVQGLFGALTVTLKLYPLVVSLHLLGGLLGVGLLAAQVSQLSIQGLRGLGSVVPSSLRKALLIFCLIWLMQSVLGAWVSTNGAVLVCADVPTCQGQWWPEMNWQQGFTLLRHLGTDGQGGTISLAALTAIHMAHRIGAVLVTLICLYLLLRLRRANCHRAAGVLLALLGWQIMAGLSNVVLGWPLLAALAHTLGAALMVAYLMLLVFPPRSTHSNHV